jgi:phosphoribosylamine--glycine ligase
MDEIILPTVRAMAEAGTPFKGVLYAGLMIGPQGPKIFEYNCRFGDPECQVLMMRLKSDIVPALIASADGGLKHFDLRWSNDTALTVVMAAKGYPDAYQKGSEIRGLDAAGKVEGVQWRAGAERERHGAHRRGGAGARLSRRRPDRLAGGLLPARYRMAGSRPAEVTPSRLRG